MNASQQASRRTVEEVLRAPGEAGLDQVSEAWLDRLYSGDGPDAGVRARDRASEIVTSGAFLEKDDDWFMRWLEGLDVPEREQTERAPDEDREESSSFVTPRLIGGLVIAVLLALLVVLFTSRLSRRKREEAMRGENARRIASRVAELRARARAAEAAGEWIEALRLDFFALVVGLGERGDLQYRDAWTNRELLDRGEPRAAVRRELKPVVVRLDAHSFGLLPSGADEVHEFRSFCDRLLEERVQ